MAFIQFSTDYFTFANKGDNRFFSLVSSIVTLKIRPFIMPATATTSTLNSTAVPATSKPAFLPYIHNFRAIAILFIVAIHCYSILKPTAEPIILQRGTLLFMFISGFLFQYLSRNFNKRIYWQKKFVNILVPYFIISLPIILIRIMTNDNVRQMQILFSNFTNELTITKIADYYLTGMHLVPFWFIPMICFYYLLGPLFIKLDRDGQIYYLLPAFIGLSLVVTRSSDLYKIHLAFIHYLSIYLLGMFASRHHLKLLQLTDRVWPAVIFTATLAVAAGVIFDQQQIHYLEQFLYVQKIILCWTILYVLWKLDNKITKKEFLIINMNKLSAMSFGIFFLHYYFLYFISLKMANGEISLAPTFTNFFLIICADIVFCVIALSVFKQLFGKKSRYLVGY